MDDFKVLMVSVQWEKPNVHSSIIRSTRPLKSVISKRNKYEYDLVLYTKEEGNYFQFCIQTELTPFIQVDGERIKLHNIENDLWIIKEDWRVGQRGIGYHYCPSINTPGKIDVVLLRENKIIYSISIDVNPQIEDFDFDQLKNDFEGELWSLITSNKSKVKTDKLEVKYCDKIFRYPESKQIIDFLGVYDKIVNNPKSELIQSVGVSSLGKVKPVTSTYRKLAVAGFSRELPSKVQVENVDIYENRYLCLMLYSIHQIVHKNVHFTSKQAQKLASDLQLRKMDVQKLQKNYIQVDPNELLAEIDDQKEALKSWKQRWEKDKLAFLNGFVSSTSSYDILTFNISGVKHYSGFPTTYWGKRIFPDGTTQWSALEFKSDATNLFEDGKELTIKFDAAYKTGNVGNHPKYSVWAIRKGSFEYVSSGREKIIQKQSANYKTYERNNWERALNSQERREQASQIQTVNKLIKRSQTQAQNLQKFVDEQQDLLPLIEQRIKRSFFKSVRWKRLIRFKPSMTFIQNINYRKALTFYKQILDSEGIDLEVFDLYEKATYYGLKEMPYVYELWCLITIIKVLGEAYHFHPEMKDIHSLLKVIDPNSKKSDVQVSIHFNNSLNGRSIVLNYQKSLNSGKRPDFILEITSRLNKINLVLDSKYKNYNYKKSLTFEIENLIKKYRGDNNYIFALHPCNDLKLEGRTVKLTNHGGDKIYFGDGEYQVIKYPFHEYGYVTIKPNETDNLKKILAMGFEYLLERNKSAKTNSSKDPKPENELFCLNCGGTDIGLISKNRGNNRYNYTAICKSADCDHELHIDYCWNCFTKLFKHGTYWDYHRTSVWSSFDIHCPNCGMTVADMPTTR